MNWDKYEAEHIVRVINEMWPQSKPLSEAQARLLQDKMPGTARVALEAIDEVAAERDQSGRPGVGAFIKKAEEIVRNSYRKTAGPGDRCSWCDGRRMVRVNVWQLSGQEVLERSVPDNMVLKQRGGGGFVVDPRIAPELGLKETVLALDCGHCDWHAGRLCIQDFAAYYRHFWAYETLREEEVGNKCLSDEEPVADADMTLREFLEHEDVGEEIAGMLEKARGR